MKMHRPSIDLGDIVIISIKQLLRECDICEQDAVIALSSYPKPQGLLEDRALFLSVDDVTNSSRPKAFKMEDAEKILAFLGSMQPIKSLYICCDGGVSRSAAVAAAITHACIGDDFNIWKDPAYHPNQLVYTTMRSTMNDECSNEELHKKIMMSEEALARKIAEASCELGCKSLGSNTHGILI